MRFNPVRPSFYGAYSIIPLLRPSLKEKTRAQSKIEIQTESLKRIEQEREQMASLDIKLPISDFTQRTRNVWSAYIRLWSHLPTQ